MKKIFFRIVTLTVATIAAAGSLYAARPDVSLVIEGTGNSASFTVDSEYLPADKPVMVIAPAGFTVSPATIPANTKGAKVIVTLDSYKAETEGKIVLRSGDSRTYVDVKGIGSTLSAKDLSKSPVYTGKEDKFETDAFKPGKKGYTIEFKVTTPNASSEFYPYFVSGQNLGVKGYVTSSGMGLYSAKSKKNVSNPYNQPGKFYNDGKAHTFRYAVTPDNMVFIYRDGFLLDTVRLVDFGPQPEFSTEVGDPKENLLKNPGFEGEFDVIPGTDIARAIEGWDVVIGDRWNSEQFIKPVEVDDVSSRENHVLQVKRYKWSDGYSAAQIAQVVNVAPDDSYTLSALVRGGIKNDGRILGKMQLQEVQNKELGVSVEITSNSWETYSLDYTTSPECKQLRVVFILERDKRGANISSLDVDNIKLTGKEVVFKPQAGFVNDGAKLDYFTYDLSGAYAPLSPSIMVNTSK